MAESGLRSKVALLVVIGCSCVSAVALADETETKTNPPPAVEPAAPAVEPAASAAHHGSVFIDPLGFLLFGPTLGVELGANRLSATLYGRWLNAGVLAKSLFLEDADSFAFSYGAGLRGRYFLRGQFAGTARRVGPRVRAFDRRQCHGGRFDQVELPRAHARRGLSFAAELELLFGRRGCSRLRIPAFQQRRKPTRRIFRRPVRCPRPEHDLRFRKPSKSVPTSDGCSRRELVCRVRRSSRAQLVRLRVSSVTNKPSR